MGTIDGNFFTSGIKSVGEVKEVEKTNKASEAKAVDMKVEADKVGDLAKLGSEKAAFNSYDLDNMYAFLPKSIQGKVKEHIDNAPASTKENADLLAMFFDARSLV